MKKALLILAILSFGIVRGQDWSKAMVYDEGRVIVGQITNVIGNDDEKKELIKEVISTLDDDMYFVHYYTEDGVLMECPFYRELKLEKI